MEAEGKGAKGRGEQREVTGERRSRRGQSRRAADVTAADCFLGDRSGRPARYYSELGLEFLVLLGSLLLERPVTLRLTVGRGTGLRSLPRMRALGQRRGKIPHFRFSVAACWLRPTLALHVSGSGLSLFPRFLAPPLKYWRAEKL